MSRLFALTSCLLLATATSATGVRGNGDHVATNGPPSQSLGCFHDKRKKHVFKAPAIHQPKSNSPASCQAACGPEFKYFAVTSGAGCFCGKAHEDFAKYGEANPNSCYHSCPGDSKETCGGTLVNEVFVNLSPTPTGNLGCFQDKPDRLFKAPMINQRYFNSPASCQEACGPKFKYFGLQHGHQCFCGKEHENFAKYGKVKANRCYHSCPGERSDTCGGEWVMEVFEMPPPPSQSLGCFHDKRKKRVFKAPGIHQPKSNSPASCQAACGPKFKYFAVTSGAGCFCGKAHEDFAKYGEANPNSCYHSCPGDSKETCGGTLVNEVFVNLSPTPTGNLGCFQDKPNRLFKAPMINQRYFNSPASCQEACGPKFKYFGLQHGHQCFCGQKHENFAKYGKVKANRCYHSCPGERSDTCGGEWVMEVFDNTVDRSGGAYRHRLLPAEGEDRDYEHEDGDEGKDHGEHEDA